MQKIISILLIIPIISSCFFRQPVDMVVSDNPFVLDKTEIEIQCNPPLSRVRTSGSLLITIKEQWNPEPPWKQIKLANGNMVAIDVLLISADGKEFIPNIIGIASGAINIRFDPEIPKNTKINLIKLKASYNLSVENIIWHNYDPK